MGWLNSNTKKQVFSITRPLEEEESLLASIPEEAKITQIVKSSLSIKVTYVIDQSITLNDIIESTKANVEPLKIEIQPRKRLHKRSALAVINIADFHLNRLAFSEETGGFDYNVETAKKLFSKIIEESVYLLQTSRYKVDKIILNTCGDFVNSDTKVQTTTKGTFQTDDLPWKQIFPIATSLLESALLELVKIAPVEYAYIMGNHDEMVGFYITSWLDARFKDIPDVEIKADPRIRYVCNYKNNVVIFTHGSAEGNRCIGLPFVENDAMKNISTASNVEVIRGHYHHKESKTEHGVYLETLSSACPAHDAWTYESGFSNPNQSEVTIFYYTDDGRASQDKINTYQLFQKLKD